ncbi:MAG: CoB--CoM heterodisulfide reductase iron-sulfur subunit A family protein [Deltaproteobacteria bacterium]|nr:CoB--CoM heterodisulfide reductase iron-sulfur subunit A family protein [Deltaproteobacteria bacterium]MBW1825931.1 CoB--CoM heterodisulfide reductase iron-sulfur subunit A family protein [Deltaproteobacteria bacterium]MBW2155203.1 CoB--CoM heterodisulfide reductase iron-sulfur subunit A family protein [Deltaproteobacteria bacterium]MBW2196324.1 CoB--CoM heterodisulfide reductase iron-sulfur subunit A family protein [Deltaproteobacteria bacterium]MBW2225910.1 CoB--CoM heterodisulfide reducta
MTDEKNDKETTAGNGKVGVYICYCGGNISDHVDVEKVRESMEKIPGVGVARTDMFMCSDPGQEMIMKDLKSGTVDRVVVASCAPSLHETTFRSAISRAGANPYIYEHANIREQVSWVHHGDPATAKAIRLVAAATAKAEGLKPLEPIRMEARQHVTVIGGGIAGLRAAKDLADCGVEVALIEKSPFLGGQLAQLEHLAPTGDPAADLITALSGQVLNDPRITVHTCSLVETFDGYVGNFTLGVKKQPQETDREKLASLNPSDRTPGEFIPFTGVLPESVPARAEEFIIETGVVVLATGFKSYTPRRGEYGYAEFHEVITLPELIRIMAENKSADKFLEINGRRIRSMSMIHCIGSRQIPGIHSEDESGNLNEYCSRTCCSATLSAANTIRQTYPGTRVFELYRDIRTYGRGQEDLYEQASKNKVIFLRFEAAESPEVNRYDGSDGFPLRVKVKDTLTFGEEVEVPVDLVVLATGMEPNNVSDLVDMMKLPVGPDRFLLEVHPKLRPVELPVGGIMLAGTCQAPMDVGEACSAAAAAAVKAAALLGRGYVELDPFVAEVDLEKCRGTGACVEACLNEGALNLVEMEVDGEKVQKAQVTSALCLGCGACVAVCSENAIDINGWTLKQYEAMVDMIVADEETA